MWHKGNTVRSSERNKIDNEAYNLIGMPVKAATKILMAMFGISRGRAEGSIARVSRKSRYKRQ